MANRRNFLRYAGAFALGSLILPACNNDQGKGETEGASKMNLIEKVSATP